MSLLLAAWASSYRNTSMLVIVLAIHHARWTHLISSLGKLIQETVPIPAHAAALLKALLMLCYLCTIADT